MSGSLGRTTPGSDTLHHIGEQCAPVKGLLSTHRETTNQGYAFNAESLGQQAVLAVDVFAVTDGRESGLVIGRRSIAGSRGKAIAEKVWDQYKIFSRI